MLAVYQQNSSFSLFMSGVLLGQEGCLGSPSGPTSHGSEAAKSFFLGNILAEWRDLLVKSDAPGGICLGTTLDGHDDGAPPFG